MTRGIQVGLSSSVGGGHHHLMVSLLLLLFILLLLFVGVLSETLTANNAFYKVKCKQTRSHLLASISGSRYLDSSCVLTTTPQVCLLLLLQLRHYLPLSNVVFVVVVDVVAATHETARNGTPRQAHN